MSWVLYSVIGGLCLTVHFLSMTALTRSGLPVSFVNLLVYGISVLGLLIYHLNSKKDVIFEMGLIPLVLIASISSFLVITLTLIAFDKAPNPGYVNAIQNLSTVLVTLSSVFLLSSSLSPIKLLGVILVVTGVIIVSVFA